MRQIKFRGKRLDNGEWIEGNYSELNGVHFITPKKNAQLPSSQYEVDPATVGQFTGLLDGNGKEIYEGDIDADKMARNHIVEYHHGGFWIQSIGSGHTERLHDDRQIEIIGNIHDNPELIKTQKEF